VNVYWITVVQFGVLWGILSVNHLRDLRFHLRNLRSPTGLCRCFSHPKKAKYCAEGNGRYYFRRKNKMNKNDLPFYLRKTIHKVFNSLGPGLFESVYEKALCEELSEMGLKFRPARMCSGVCNEHDQETSSILVEEQVLVGTGTYPWRVELYQP